MASAGISSRIGRPLRTAAPNGASSRPLRHTRSVAPFLRPLRTLARTGPWLLLFLAIGCAFPVRRVDWSSYQGPGAAAFHRPELPPPRFPDPLEPLNRGVALLNHGLIVGVANPLGFVYRLVVPRFVRDRVRDFATNLTAPRRVAANLLEGKLEGARDETVRFAIDTTLGLGGLWDPAGRYWGWRATDEDFGQVFAAWGWRPSTFVMLPLGGPSTVRDAVGLVPDSLLDPATYYFPAGPVLAWNELADQIPGYLRFVATRFDPYDDGHLVWQVLREEEIEGAPASPRREQDTAAVQTLQAAFLAPRDPHFVDTLATGRARIPTTGRELPYSYRLQEGRAPLVFLVPGLGAHRLSGGSLALAEMAWRRGFSVAVISSAMSFEFLERASSAAVPGYAPVDAHDVHVALDAVDRDLAAHHPDRVGARVLMGYSLGAFHALFIAAAEPEERNLVHFDRYLTLDAPVSLLRGLTVLDDFYDAPMALPPDQRAAEVDAILRKAVAVGRRALAAPVDYARLDSTDIRPETLQPGGALPFSNLEAKYLIGLAFRRTLQEILWVSQSREDLGVLRTRRSWWRRQSAYIEMGDYSLAEYFYAFVLPYYRDRRHTVADAAELIGRCDLHALAARLRAASPRIRHFANSNDFLTSDADEAWLRDVLGADRVRFFPRGGHLGNLNQPEVQDAVMDAIQDLLPASTRGTAPTATRRPPRGARGVADRPATGPGA
jgi:hypothetical protein